MSKAPSRLTLAERVLALRPRGLRAVASAIRDDLELRRKVPSLSSYLGEVRTLTMVPDNFQRALVRQLVTLHDSGIGGSIVECGSWRGGVGILVARVLSALSDERPIFMCDSFEGLPPPQDVDGDAAIAWSQNTAGPNYHDNCRADLLEVQKLLAERALQNRVTLVKGWFESSLPSARGSFGPIALLRIDADWHASVSLCLELLYDQVVPGGFIVFDDYDTWDGCAIAVHQFLGRRALGHRLQRDGCAYIRKT